MTSMTNELPKEYALIICEHCGCRGIPSAYTATKNGRQLRICTNCANSAAVRDPKAMTVEVRDPGS
jgi:hypothetical protein